MLDVAFGLRYHGSWEYNERIVLYWLRLKRCFSFHKHWQFHGVPALCVSSAQRPIRRLRFKFWIYFCTDCVGVSEAVFEGGSLLGCIRVSVLRIFFPVPPVLGEKKVLIQIGAIKRFLPQFAASSPDSEHFYWFVSPKKMAQFTEWCLQQSQSLSSPCFHDNGMTCLVPPKERGKEGGRETNPVFLTAPKCLPSHPQPFSPRQTQQNTAIHPRAAFTHNYPH